MMRKCKACGIRYKSTWPSQVACSIQCAISIAKVKSKIIEAKEHREAKLKLKGRAQWLREAQSVFNRWIRKRDSGNPCISCGRIHLGQIHAGHYLSTGSHPELRFDERNVHAQCAPCNTHLSGNQAMYRTGLISKIGLKEVEDLEGPHPVKKYTIDELKAIKAEYTRRLRI